MDTKKPVKVEPKEAPSVESSFQFPVLSRFVRDFDSLFGRWGHDRFMFEPFKTFWTEPAKAFWTPDVEVFERNGQYMVRADLPGMKKEDVSVEVTDDELVLRGERKQEKEEKEEGYYRSERSYGSFYRTIPLPEGVKIDQAKAAVHDGVLEVQMPITKIEAKRRHLEIQESVAGEKSVKHAA